PKDGYLLRQGACTASGETSAQGSRVPSRRSPLRLPPRVKPMVPGGGGWWEAGYGEIRLILTFGDEIPLL
ncbi:MAG: hypothetical protein ACE144_11620, partial [Thermodesulfobacteriota bacterium]